MSKGTAIIGMLVAFAVGYFLGGFSKAGGGPGTGPAAVANVPSAALPDQNVDRYKVPVGNNTPTRGDERAKVTIIEWSDFQCPFCSRVEPTVDQILKTYGRDVRVVWKNNPLPFHQNAMPAAAIDGLRELEPVAGQLADRHPLDDAIGEGDQPHAVVGRHVLQEALGALLGLGQLGAGHGARDVQHQRHHATHGPPRFPEIGCLRLSKPRSV